MNRELLEGLAEEVRAGRRADNAFKKESYMRIMPNIQRHVTQTDSKGRIRVLDQEKLSAKRQGFKNIYIALTRLLDCSGINFNETTNMVIASEEFWKDYLLVS
jgi:hypothetical protein